MTLRDIVIAMHLTVRTGGNRLDRIVTGGYSGDLMSDVIAHGNAGELWITIQSHVNVVAVAVLKDLAGVLIAQGREPETETLQRAEKEHVTILTGDRSAFALSGDLSRLLRGPRP